MTTLGATPRGKAMMPPATPEGFRLEARAATRVYGRSRVPNRPGVTAVNAVDLMVTSTDRLGIVGESGSGKSTLGRLLAGLEPPTDGSVTWNGNSLTELDRSGRRRFRRSVQMVFQDPFTAFNPRRRIIASFRDVMRSWGARDDNAIRARAIDLAERVGLDAVHLDRFPHQLSGGQRQRLVIARCLAVEPEILIADESVSALDVSVQAQVLNLFRELVDDLGLGLVFISHDLRAVGFAAEHTVVMYRGRIVEQGRTADILKAPSHPYTAALVAAAFGESGVMATTPERARLVEPGGDNDSDLDDPALAGAACAYAGRCLRRPMSDTPERCREDVPVLVTVGADQMAACHFPAAKGERT